MLDSLTWGSPSWVLPALAIVAVATTLVVWSYRGTRATPGVRVFAGLLKSLGLLLLAFCLLEPLINDRRVRPGANLFVVLADNSASLHVRDEGVTDTRGERLQKVLEKDTPWSTRLAQDFDVRRYLFDSRLRSTDDFEELEFDGSASSLAASLDAVTRRYEGRPLAGVLVLSDGISTDELFARAPESMLEGESGKWPSVYPIAFGSSGAVRDISIDRVSVSETNFETAPISVRADVVHTGFDRQAITTELLDAEGLLIDESTQKITGDGRLHVRFEIDPDASGVQFYRLRTRIDPSGGEEDFDDESDEEDAPSFEEGTNENNSRLVVVDRFQGPYRILYVSGRPNWEFKFLRRALEDDPEVELTGLIRIAKREPKFEYRSRIGESTNPLFRGFDKEQDETTEQYDEAVFLRLGTRDENELRDGFPKTSEVLFAYDAVILDDVEAGFFTQQQMTLLQDFVSRRGGGFLMLGGAESFAKGKYRRTPIGDLLPVYVDASQPFAPASSGYRLDLTREGRMQSWLRLRKTEAEELDRLASMPPFLTYNPVRGIKPGAIVLARAVDEDGGRFPAFVTQRFGKGRSAALLIGDLWRWGLRRDHPTNEDPARAWRQIARWLVSDVPRSTEMGFASSGEAGHVVGSTVRLAVRVRDESFSALDNAGVKIVVDGADGARVELPAVASTKEAGVYEADYAPREKGAYLARAKVSAPDGSELPGAEFGWTAEPTAEEFRTLEPDREALERLAKRTGGEMVEVDKLDEFVAGLPERSAPVMDPWVYPLWHRWTIFWIAVACLCGEWAIRRLKGMP